MKPKRLRKKISLSALRAYSGFASGDLPSLILPANNRIAMLDVVQVHRDVEAFSLAWIHPEIISIVVALSRLLHLFYLYSQKLNIFITSVCEQTESVDTFNTG